MVGLDFDSMTVLWPNEYIVLTFYFLLSNRIADLITFFIEDFYMPSLDYDEMSILWQYDCKLFDFSHLLIHQNTKCNNLCKIIFGSDAWFRFWYNDCFCDQMTE